jgi:hypothetical protein
VNLHHDLVLKLRRIDIGKKTVGRIAREAPMSFLSRLHQARTELNAHTADPWRGVLERNLPANVNTISSVALLDLLDVPATTGNGRRLAKTMRSMGFIPLKSRRLMPGGFRDTTIRGWARPIRESGNQTSLKEDDKVKRSEPVTLTTPCAAARTD